MRLPSECSGTIVTALPPVFTPRERAWLESHFGRGTSASRKSILYRLAVRFRSFILATNRL